MHSVADFKMFNTFFFCVMYESRIQLGLLHIGQANLYEIKTLCDGFIGGWEKLPWDLVLPLHWYC